MTLTVRLNLLAVSVLRLKIMMGAEIPGFRMLTFSVLGFREDLETRSNLWFHIQYSLVALAPIWIYLPDRPFGLLLLPPLLLLLPPPLLLLLLPLLLLLLLDVVFV